MARFYAALEEWLILGFLLENYNSRVVEEYHDGGGFAV